MILKEQKWLISLVVIALFVKIINKYPPARQRNFAVLKLNTKINGNKVDIIIHKSDLTQYTRKEKQRKKIVK